MSRTWAPVLLWAVLIAVMGAVAVVIFTTQGAATPALFGGAAVLMAVLAAYLATRRGGAPDEGDRTPRVVQESSLPSVAVAVSIAGMLLGAELGLWLVYIAGGALVISLAGLLRESRAAREVSEQVLAASRTTHESTAAGEGRGPRGHLPGEG